VAFSDNKNAFKGTTAYDPFGQVLSATGEMASMPAQGALRYQGDLTDASTGQVDMGARVYEPVLGRFSSMDPLFGELTSPLSLNRFVYGMSSPVTFDDPTGLCADPDLCPPQIGFGTTQTHSGGWKAAGAAHATAAKYVRYYEEPDPRVYTRKTFMRYETPFYWPGMDPEPATVTGAIHRVVSYIILDDIGACLHGDGASCFLAAMAIVPSGKAASLLRFADEASGVLRRTDEIAAAVDEYAQRFRTTAILRGTDEVGQSIDVVASGGVDLVGSQVRMLRGSEIAAKAKGVHAEVTALRQATSTGLDPRFIATSRPICPTCQAELIGAGATILDPRLAAWGL